MSSDKGKRLNPFFPTRKTRVELHDGRHRLQDQRTTPQEEAIADVEAIGRHRVGEVLVTSSPSMLDRHKRSITKETPSCGTFSLPLRGVVATRPILRGERIAFIPFSSVITGEKAYELLQACGALGRTSEANWRAITDRFVGGKEKKEEEVAEEVDYRSKTHTIEGNKPRMPRSTPSPKILITTTEGRHRCLHHVKDENDGPPRRSSSSLLPPLWPVPDVDDFLLRLNGLPRPGEEDTSPTARRTEAWAPSSVMLWSRDALLMTALVYYLKVNPTLSMHPDPTRCTGVAASTTTEKEEENQHHNDSNKSKQHVVWQEEEEDLVRPRWKRLAQWVAYWPRSIPPFGWSLHTLGRREETFVSPFMKSSSGALPPSTSPHVLHVSTTTSMSRTTTALLPAPSIPSTMGSSEAKEDVDPHKHEKSCRSSSLPRPPEVAGNEADEPMKRSSTPHGQATSSHHHHHHAEEEKRQEEKEKEEGSSSCALSRSFSLREEDDSGSSFSSPAAGVQTTSEAQRLLAHAMRKGVHAVMETHEEDDHQQHPSMEKVGTFRVSSLSLSSHPTTALTPSTSEALVPAVDGERAIIPRARPTTRQLRDYFRGNLSSPLTVAQHQHQVLPVATVLSHIRREYLRRLEIETGHQLRALWKAMKASSGEEVVGVEEAEEDEEQGGLHQLRWAHFMLRSRGVRLPRRCGLRTSEDEDEDEDGRDDTFALVPFLDMLNHDAFHYNVTYTTVPFSPLPRRGGGKDPSHWGEEGGVLVMAARNIAAGEALATHYGNQRQRGVGRGHGHALLRQGLQEVEDVTWNRFTRARDRSGGTRSVEPRLRNLPHHRYPDKEEENDAQRRYHRRRHIQEEKIIRPQPVSDFLYDHPTRAEYDTLLPPALHTTLTTTTTHEDGEDGLPISQDVRKGFRLPREFRIPEGLLRHAATLLHCSGKGPLASCHRSTSTPAAGMGMEWTTSSRTTRATITTTAEKEEEAARGIQKQGIRSRNETSPSFTSSSHAARAVSSSFFSPPPHLVAAAEMEEMLFQRLCHAFHRRGGGVTGSLKEATQQAIQARREAEAEMEWVWRFGFPRSEEEVLWDASRRWSSALRDRIAQLTDARRKGRPGEFVLGVPEGLQYLRSQREELEQDRYHRRRIFPPQNTS